MYGYEYEQWSECCSYEYEYEEKRREEKKEGNGEDLRSDRHVLLDALDLWRVGNHCEGVHRRVVPASINSLNSLSCHTIWVPELTVG